MPERANQTDIAVVGGGAAGLTAAVLCARSGLQTVVLEKAPRVGKKLLATGNGTCNLTNLSASPARYHGKGAADFVRPVLEAYPPRRIMRFFEELGLVCQVREDGRVYPRTAQASAVLDCLPAGPVRRRRRGTDRMPGHSDPEDGGRLPSGYGRRSSECPPGPRWCRRGSGAPPSAGGAGRLYAAHGFGPYPYPAVSLHRAGENRPGGRACDQGDPPGRRRFLLPGRPALSQETGELLFTEYGLSGPAVMQASRPCRGLGAEEGRPDDSDARSAA